MVLSISSDENIGKNLLSGYIPLLMVPSAYKLAVTCLLVFTSSFISYCIIMLLITISQQVKIWNGVNLHIWTHRIIIIYNKPQIKVQNIIILVRKKSKCKIMTLENNNTTIWHFPQMITWPQLYSLWLKLDIFLKVCSLLSHFIQVDRSREKQ